MPTKKLTSSESKHKNINIPSGNQHLTVGFQKTFDIVYPQGRLICRGKTQMNGARLNIKPLYSQVLLGQLGLQRPLQSGDTIDWDVANCQFVINGVTQSIVGAHPVGKPRQRSARKASVKVGALNIFDVVASVNSTLNCGLTSPKDFKLFYRILTKKLNSGGFYISITPTTTKSIKSLWPANHGVYVIREKATNDLIYVGKAGTFKKGKLVGNLIDGTNNRRFPYQFTNKNEFAYNFNSKSGVKYIPLADLLIDCFVVDKFEFDAPASLESMILQAHLMCYKNLPFANNAF
jgi:hypothetical protein